MGSRFGPRPRAVDLARAVFKDDVGEDAFRTHLKGEPPIAPVEWQALELLVRADEALARAADLGPVA